MTQDATAAINPVSVNEIATTEPSATIDGLEQFFEEPVHPTDIVSQKQPETIAIAPNFADHGGLNDGGLTIKQAVYYYNLPSAKIKKAIRDGEIPAMRVRGPKGSRWRIFPVGVPEELKSPTQPAAQPLPPPDLLTNQQEEIEKLTRSVSRLNDELSTAFHLIAELQSQIIRSRQEVEAIGAAAKAKAYATKPTLMQRLKSMLSFPGVC